MTEETIVIQGMSCQHCVMAVRKELEKIPGLTVRDVRIGSATVILDPEKVPVGQLARAVEEAGFAMVR